MDVCTQENGPTETAEILGSVTHNIDFQDGNRAFPIQLRSSARVSKKLRLDIQEKVEAQDKKVEFKVEEKRDAKPSLPLKRTHFLWPAEDKNAFFEALNEFGKDFDAIQTYMNNKQKKKHVPNSVGKNRDQARHFYYRTWHKISKHLKFPDVIKKATQELYALINFGEFRKKAVFVPDKNAMKLNELIFTGTTQIRQKGKTIRIKTPVCRALKKLNRLEECKDDFKLPARVLVEMRPRDNAVWCKVQSLAMNPRVRATLPLHRKLQLLILHLTQKWQTTEMKLINQLQSSGNLKDMNYPEFRAVLRVAPKQGLNISVPTVTIREVISSSEICLLSYADKYISTEVSRDYRSHQFLSGNKSSKSTKQAKKSFSEERSLVDDADKYTDGEKLDQNDSSEKCADHMYNDEAINAGADGTINADLDASMNIDADGSMNMDAEASINMDADGSMNMDADGANQTDVEDGSKEEEVMIDSQEETEEDFVSMTVQQLLSLNTKNDYFTMYGENEEDEADRGSKEDIPISTIKEQKEALIAKARAGWTVDTADMIRIGDLYLMFGREGKVELEYWWDEGNGEFESPIRSSAVLSTALQRLISIAKLNFNKDNVVRSCGASKINIAKSAKPKWKSSSNEKETENVPKNPSFVAPRPPNPSFNPHPKIGMTTFKEQVDTLRTRYFNRRGRASEKPKTVVQRILPVLGPRTGTHVHAPEPSPDSSVVPDVQISPSTTAICDSTTTETVSVDASEQPVLDPPLVIEQHFINPPLIMAPTLDGTTWVSMPTSTLYSTVTMPDSYQTIVNPSCYPLPGIADPNASTTRLNRSGICTPIYPASWNGDINANTPPSPPGDEDGRVTPNWMPAESSNYSLSSLLGHLESLDPSDPSLTREIPQDETSNFSLNSFLGKIDVGGRSVLSFEKQFDGNNHAGVSERSVAAENNEMIEECERERAMNDSGVDNMEEMPA